jgi:hypothetical protein
LIDEEVVLVVLALPPHVGGGVKADGLGKTHGPEG